MWTVAAEAALSAAARTLDVALGVAVADGVDLAAHRRAGRRAAARALQASARGPIVIGRADDGRAVWPSGTTGSIAHANGVAVAVVAAAGRAVGVDIEVAGALSASDAIHVLTDAELAIVAADAAPDRLTTRLWSAKEAAFKAWSTALGGVAGVDPVDIHVELSPGLQVRAGGELADRVRSIGSLHGSSIEHGEWVLTLVADGRGAASSARGRSSRL